MQDLSELRQKVKGNAQHEIKKQLFSINLREDEKKSQKEYKIINTKKTKAKSPEESTNDIEKMKDMNFVCPLLKEALNLEVCSRRIIKETASLNDSLDYVQQQGWSGAKGGLA